MPIVRDEFSIRRASIRLAPTGGNDVEITTLDVGLRYSTDGELVLCSTNERAQMIAGETGNAGDSISVIYATSGARIALRMSGTGSAGRKISCDSNGNFVQSSTAETAVLVAGQDLGVALEDWTNGETVEVDILAE